MIGGVMSNIIKKDSHGFKEILDGIRKQNLAIGERTHMVRFFLEKGKLIPVHHHSQEQTGYMIKGKMVLSIAEVDNRVETGDSWSIKADVPHSAKIIEECEVIEVFSPVRDDYLD